VFGGHHLFDDAEDAFAVWLAGHLEIEAADIQMEQIGQQAGVVDVGAMSGIAVAARANMDTDAVTVGYAEAVEDLVVEVDEGAQETAGRIEFEGEAAFGEVDLDGVGTGIEGAADVGSGFVDEVGEEVARGSSRECRRRDRAG
jgi:hypothetical protein